MGGNNPASVFKITFCAFTSDIQMSNALHAFVEKSRSVDWRNPAPVLNSIPLKSLLLILKSEMFASLCADCFNIKCGVLKGMVFKTGAGFR